MLGVAALLLLGLFVATLAMTLYTAWMLTHPARRSAGWALARNLPSTPSEFSPLRRYQAWTFKPRLSLGEFEVWDVRGDVSGGPAVIITHGWGESRVVALQRLEALCAGASRVILWDMAGHGDAPGRCALGTREVGDLLALIERLGPAPIVLYGSSLGAGVSIVAATRAPAGKVRAVIAEAPYRVPPTPARNVLRSAGLPWRLNLWPAMWLLGFTPGALRRFDRAAHAANMNCPLHVLHGDHDAVCPIDDGRAIAKAATRGAMHVVEGGRHLDLWTDPVSRAKCTALVGQMLTPHGDE